MNFKSIRQGQFYINNVCNLACSNCSSFNNLKFKGHLSWEDSRDKIFKWREILTFEELAILGGEPFSHPDLDTWVYNLRDLFPEVKDFRITTNATLFSSNIDRIRSYLDKKIIIECSIHSRQQWQPTLEQIKTILGDRVVDTKYRDGGLFYYENDQPLFEVRPAWEFVNNSLEIIKNGVLYFHNSDPNIAHNACLWKDCHYFVNGNLYKCVVTATAGLLGQQFSIYEKHQQIISTIEFANPFDDIEKVINFIDKIEMVCPQCTLCPEKVNFKEFNVQIKKLEL